jgi:hypothetical protein
VQVAEILPEQRVESTIHFELDEGDASFVQVHSVVGEHSIHVQVRRRYDSGNGEHFNILSKASLPNLQ